MGKGLLGIFGTLPSERYKPSIRGFASGSAEERRTRPEECGRAVSSCVVKPEGSAAPAPILTSVDMPEGEMARAAMKRSWRSGCGCAAGSVLTKPPWSHATDVSGPRLRRSHCSRASGLGFVDRGSLVRESFGFFGFFELNCGYMAKVGVRH